MNIQEILQMAQDANPEMMEKTAETLAILDRMSPEYTQDVLDEFKDVLAITMEKSAAAPGFIESTAKGLGSMAILGLGTAIAADLYDVAKRGLSKGYNFKRIMNANPDLSKADKAALKTSFDTLHHYAPDFTSDPAMGGQILQSMVEIPQNQATVIKDLIKAQKELRESRKGPFQGKASGGH